MGGRAGVRLPSMAILSLVSRIDSLCHKCLVTSSSSSPSCRASCSPFNLDYCVQGSPMPAPEGIHS